ncbi:MAG: thiamine-phosphate kinase [Sphingomonas sp.]|uniref:thiamine-phosphate kinase n=1 Tax=Sphingomonas sp. TaxID=28214 RepID=UPI0025F3A7F3|nr:thiamine-phosphate kinase [Sphingomonas sp.]MBX3563475.1 thiamine-phosphate kinase [Sphingomonas sp.]
MNEADFIAALRTLPLHPGAHGLLDDTATLTIGGETLVLTHDAIAEGVHYLPGTDPADIAWKLVAVNLSDLAAKGAEPIGVLIGATLSDERFIEGLRDILETYKVPLLGGDTIATSPAVFGCTAIGRATGPIPTRNGAKVGDLIWLTGSIGAAMIGYQTLRDQAADLPEEEAVYGDTSRYLRPVPRLYEGRALAPHVHAMMDVSDGLLLDASRIAVASNCTLAIQQDRVPFSPGACDLRELEALGWGDDYELLFTAPESFDPPIDATCIGHVLAPGPAPLLLDGMPPTGDLGYEHR